MAPITRRSALLTAGVVGLAGEMTAEKSAAAEEPAATSFKTRLSKPKCVKPKVADLGDLPSVNISPDGQTIGILFDTVQLELGDGGDLTATLVASLFIPVSAQEPAVENFRGYSAFVRGFISKDPGTRVVVTVDLGESHDVAEFPYGPDVSEDYKRSIFCYPVVEEKREKSEGAFETVQIAPAPHIPATLTLSIQRRTAQDRALVSIDSLDVEIVDTAKGPAKGEKGPAGKKPSRRYNRERKGR